MKLNKLAKLHALKAEMKKLENDPTVQQEQLQQEQVISYVHELGMTPQAAAEMLVPTLGGAKSILAVKGLASQPAQATKKWMLHLELLHLERRVNERLEELREDPEILEREILLHEIERIGLTSTAAAGLLNPDALASGQLPKGPGSHNQDTLSKRKPRVEQYWRNPHTGECVAARSTAKRELQRWVAEYGTYVLIGWKISCKEYIQETDA